MKKTALAIVQFLFILALLGLMSCTQSTLRESEPNVITDSLSTQRDTETPKIADENTRPLENGKANKASDVNAANPEETTSPNDLSLGESSRSQLDANPTDTKTHPSDARTRPPDGRIYFGSDEPIGYIPTNYPKEWENIPLTPPAF